MSQINLGGLNNEDLLIIKNHFHNRELWLGKSADQSGNDWAFEFSTSPFRAISGNNDFGSDPNDEAKVIGTEDMPIFLGQTAFTVYRLIIVAATQNTVFSLRFVWGTGTMAEAITANQYTSLMLNYDSFPMSPYFLIFPRVDNGNKVWCQAKNITNNASIDFYVSAFGY